MDPVQGILQLVIQATLQMGGIVAMLVAESEEADEEAALAQAMQVHLNQAALHTWRT